MRNISGTLPLEPEMRDDVGQVIETIIYLYTESRRITKELARRAQQYTAPPGGEPSA